MKSFFKDLLKKYKTDWDYHVNYKGIDESRFKQKPYPKIFKSFEINKYGTNFYSEQISYFVFKAIVELEDDLEVWKWFKYPTYDENLEIEILEKNHKFKIYGGPRHTATVYEKFKSKIGDRINDVEFMAFSEFEGKQILHIFWMHGNTQICVYSIVKSRIFKVISLFDENFSLLNPPVAMSMVVWEWSRVFLNKENNIFWKPITSNTDATINVEKPLTEEIEMINTWHVIAYKISDHEFEAQCIV